MSSGTELTLAERLIALRRLDAGRRDPALQALFAAADQALVEWRRQERHAAECQRELERATGVADVGQRRLEALLAAIGDLAVSAPAARERSGRRRIVDWFLGGTRRSVAPETESADMLGDQWSQASDDITPQRRPDARRRDVDLAAHLFGSFRLRRAGQDVDARNGGKGGRILRYLMAHHKEPVPKDVLVEHFWPDANLETIGRNLHQTIYTVRRLLRDGGPDLDYILFANEAYLVNPALSFWSDVEEFESCVTVGRNAEATGQNDEAMLAYTRAEVLYTGPYLADSPYEEWIMSERDRLRLRYLDVANRLADFHFERGNIDTATDVSRRLLRHEACDEAAHRRLIRCYGAAGRRHLVVEQYQTYIECSERLYGLGPSSETTLLYESVLAECQEVHPALN